MSLLVLAAVSLVACAGGSGSTVARPSATPSARVVHTAPNAATPRSPGTGTPHTFTAEVFMRGMKVTVPSAEWFVWEDHGGEFNLAAPPGPTGDPIANIHFWLDPRPVVHRGSRHVPVRGVANSPHALIAWLRANRYLIVSAPRRHRIASGVTAQSVDLDVARTAPRETTECTRPCLTYFAFAGIGYNTSFGTARGNPVRLYLATVGRAAHRHTIAIAVDAVNADAFGAVKAPAARLLKSIRLPRRISAGQ